MRVSSCTAPGPRPALVLATLLATVLAALVTAPVRPVHADAGTWTVAPGGGVSATAPAEIRNTTRGWTIRCASSFSGTAPPGADQPGYGLISFDQGSLTGCTGPDSLTTTAAVVNLPWDLYATSYDTAAGRTTGTFSNINLTLDASNGCRMDVSAPDGGPGWTDATYTSGDHILNLTGAHLSVTFTNYRCAPDLVAAGDTIELAASLPISPAQTISSP
ncbi:hypothetical protein E1287_39085 [Actinomadura sp. KC06]|uniref:hypothetical protein n=1 Tax=Actinomadura sp. KC06 TaxID=2530369 RepID=UPI0010495D85|nr:hypothetical protein [Actinomadura sp. KC06]TDD23329.1 hypothetical protein E1287_39085 [Actinomadura sp. KC06]